MSIARVMLSLSEEIELFSNCNDTLIQQRIDQCRSAEAGTQACWRHDASPLDQANPATIDCGKPATTLVRTETSEDTPLAVTSWLPDCGRAV